MLEAKVSRASILKRIFEVIRDMVTDVNLDCNEEGLKLQAMDSSHVALVTLSLEDSGFLHYRCDRERALGLNMPAVCKVFKLCGNTDSVAIHNEDESDTVTFVFENTDERISTFSLKLMAIDQDALGVPDNDQDWDVVMKIPSKELVNICRTMQEFSDTVRIEADKTGIKFCTLGDVGSGEIILKPREPSGEGDDVGVELKVQNPICQSYAVKHLNQFAKAGSLSDAVCLSLSNDKPVEVKFCIQDKSDLANSNTRIGQMKFFLAPKMEETGDAMME